MNLREQFEKEMGKSCTYSIHLYNGEEDEAVSDHYVEWLEQRNKEQVEVLNDTFKHIHWCNSVGCRPSLDVARQIEEQLKKSDCQLGG